MQCFKHGDAIALFPGHSILQPWRKIDFSPRLQDKIWEWPGNEDGNAIEMHNRISFDFYMGLPIVASVVLAPMDKSAHVNIPYPLVRVHKNRWLE